MSIQQFKAALTGGGARANQFRVTMSFPSIVSGTGSAAQKVQFLCSATTLPGSNIGVAPAAYRGRQVPLPGERTFQPWTIQCINDTDFDIRDAFERWMEQLNSVKENTGITNPNLQGAQMSVAQLDRNGSVLKTYTFVDAWPSDLGEIQLNYSTNNVLEEFSVTFQYSYWEQKTTKSSISANVAIATPFGSLTI